MLLEILSLAIVTTTLVGILFLARGDPMSPLFLFPLLVTPKLVLRGGLLLVGGVTPVHPDLFEVPYRRLALRWVLLAAVGIAIFVAAYGWANRNGEGIVDALPRFNGDIRTRRLAAVTIGLLAFNTVVYLYFLAKLGDVGTVFHEARHGLFKGRHLLQKIPGITSVLASLLIVSAWEDRRRPWMYGLLLVWAVGILLAYGDRSALVTPILIGLMGIHYTVRRVPTKKLLIVLGVLALVVMVAGDLRGFIWAEASGRDVSFQERVLGGFQDPSDLLERVSEGVNGHALDFALVVFQDFGWGEYRYGEDFWIGLQGVIPRALWEGKPDVIRTGGWFTETYTPEKSGGQPPGAMAEWWMNFGLAGVLFAYTAGGAFWGLARRYFQQTGYPLWAAGFQGVMIFMGVGMIYHTGTPLQVALYLVPYVLVLLYVVRPEDDGPLLVDNEGEEYSIPGWPRNGEPDGGT